MTAITLTLTPGEDSIQSIRALSAYCRTRGPGEPLTAAVDRIGEALRYGHPVTVTIGDTDPDPCEAGTCDCITYPHTWGPSGQRCTRCPAAGTGDPCGDGDCPGHPDYTRPEES